MSFSLLKSHLKATTAKCIDKHKKERISNQSDICINFPKSDSNEPLLKSNHSSTKVQKKKLRIIKESKETIKLKIKSIKEKMMSDERIRNENMKINTAVIKLLAK